MRAVVGSALNLKVLKESADLGTLAYLYDDDPGREALVRRLANQPGFSRFLRSSRR